LKIRHPTILILHNSLFLFYPECPFNNKFMKKTRSFTLHNKKYEPSKKAD